MPLTNVWTQDINGEWIRTDAAMTDRLYSDTVSVDSRRFRCYSCFQYVTFVKGNNSRISHFRHSTGYSDKDCEDRSFNTSTEYLNKTTSTADMPIRLVLDGSRLQFSIGLLPVSQKELETCISDNMRIILSVSQGDPLVYRVDWDRFMPNSITWLAVPASGISELRVTFHPMAVKPKVWSGVLAEIPDSGALFDAETHRRIPDKGDAVVNREYLLLLKRGNGIRYNSKDIQVIKQSIDDPLWNVFRIRALRFSEAASDFFFHYPHVRLTNCPVEMSVVWPPVLEKDGIIETNHRNIKLLMKGEAEFSTYPNNDRSYTASLLHDNARLIDIRNTSALQMVTSERYHHTLQFMYVRPIEHEFNYSSPKLEIRFDDEQPCTDTQLNSVPVRGTLHFLASDDGYIDIFENDEFCYRKILQAHEETRVTEIKYNSRLLAYIGLELISEITIATPNQKRQSIQYSDLPTWYGRKIPFPKKYAWVLNGIDESSELYHRIQSALHQGTIPQDGWNTIQMMMEGNRNAF